MNRPLIRRGFILITAALLAGLFIPSLRVPRLGLSAHTIGLLGGLLLVALEAVWRQFDLSPRQVRWMAGAWLYANWVNWAGVLVAAALGTGRATPIASAGAEGAPSAEAAVGALLISVALASFLGTGLSLWGLRGAKAPA